MEPIRNTKTARLRRLKMYREDLDGLVALFHKGCRVVTISDGKNRYDSLDEMKTHVGPKITNLDIRGENPGVHFLLNQQEQLPGHIAPAAFNELRTEETTDEADNLFFILKDFLVERQQRSVRLGFLVLCVIAVAGMMLFGQRNADLQSHGQQSMRVLVGLAFSMIVFVISFAGTIFVTNYLSLETSLNSPSFWARHQEAFVAHAVTASISSILGGTVGWFACHFLK